MYLATARYQIRPATKDDIGAMTDVYFDSFNNIFWQYFTPDTPGLRNWWDEAWTIGLNNPTDRTFVVEDTERDSKVVAFSRWMVPQDDGSIVRPWPEPSPDDWDMDLAGAFFGGMEENHRELMGTRPHWMLEMLGVREEYQRQGIGATLIKWGTDQADRDNLETYLDASTKGQPYYKKQHGFGGLEKDVVVPDRPAYGSFSYRSLVRQPQKG